MEIERLIDARRAAEAAVQDMADDQLKNTAFATILAHQLQQQSAPGQQVSPVPPRVKLPAAKKSVGQRRDGTTARLLGLIEENFFRQPRSLAEIRSALAERGWHYQVEALGTPVTRLVQSKHKYLRRTQASDGGKKLWKYSNY
jgi:hypothetical protein